MLLKQNSKHSNEQIVFKWYRVQIVRIRAWGFHRYCHAILSLPVSTSSPRSPWLRDEFHWDTFDHPPYSPDLAPSDFHLFLKMKEHLAGKRHADDDLQHAVVDWLNSQAAVWYEEGISKLVSRYDKCLNVQGDYVEK